MKILFSILCFCSLFFGPIALYADYKPVTFQDSIGKEHTFKKRPCRVVSLVPSMSEIMMKIGAEECLLATTHHSMLPSGISEKEIIGGFVNPSLDEIERFSPEIIFYVSLQKKIPERFKDGVSLINLQSTSIEESFNHIRLLGKIFGCEDGAANLVNQQQRQISLMNEKLTHFPDQKKKRVIRLMGYGSNLYVPGDDSFQNEYITLSGAIPPKLGRNGQITSLNLEEWKNFNPQHLYGCGKDRTILEFLQQPGWKDVEAVRKNNISFFPCELTCRAATNTGFFISWLSSSLYPDYFSSPENLVLKETIVRESAIHLDIPYLKEAKLVESNILDFRHKTLLLEFTSPMTVLSTLSGWQKDVVFAGNHYLPPPSWGLGHEHGVAGLHQMAKKILGLSGEKISLLFTGADMHNLSISKQSFRDMSITALVTAGVSGNSLRMGRDEGKFYEPASQKDDSQPGTINILLLSNMKLSLRAMSRAIITATEAKSAALQDLDIRSSYSGAMHGATGTGTDNIIVIEGIGRPIDSSGGHTKLGELIGKAVHQAVTEAIFKQNGYTGNRSIFQRLRERSIRLSRLKISGGNTITSIRDLEDLLLENTYSSFLESALTLSDAHEKGLIDDLTSFDIWCKNIASLHSSVSPKPITIHEDSSLPIVVKKALEALLTNLSAQRQQKESQRAEG